MRVIILTSILFLSSLAMAETISPNQVVCNGMTAKSKQMISISFCFDMGVLSETGGEYVQLKSCYEDPYASITKYRPDETKSLQEMKIGSASYVSQEDGFMEIFLTDYDGELEGIELESEGYQTFRISMDLSSVSNWYDGASTSSMTMNLQKQWWMGYSFANAACSMEHLD